MLRSQTFAIPNYSFQRHNKVELRYAKLRYGIRYDTLRYATLQATICSMISNATMRYDMQYFYLLCYIVVETYDVSLSSNADIAYTI